MNGKFVKQPITPARRLSKEATLLLANLNAQTHPDLNFRAWVEDPNKDTTKAINEMIDGGYAKEINGVLNPTILGVQYFNKPAQTSSTPDVAELIRQIKQALPRNPKFGVVVEGLTDTALMGLIYACFGEIGRRGDPEVPETFQYWQGKVDALKGVLTDATPDTLWQHHQKQLESFGTQDVVVKKTTKKAKQ